MPNEEISNSAIALLDEIGEFSPDAASRQQTQSLSELVAFGFVEVDPAGIPPRDRYKLTAKGSQFLGERGAGLDGA